MRLAHVSIGGRGATDRFLAAVAGRLEDAGVRLAGTVQTNLGRADRSRLGALIRAGGRCSGHRLGTCRCRAAGGGDLGDDLQTEVPARGRGPVGPDHGPGQIDRR